ncbi:MAG: glycosyltransferase [Aeoliella sp.]
MKRIVLISSVFFPFPIVGAVRATNWARMLSENGYQVVVITRDRRHRASPERLAAEVRSQIELLQMLDDGTVAPREDSRPAAPTTPKPEGFKRKWIRRTKGWWVPDGSIRFWKKVYPQVRQLVRERECDLVLTTSPMSATAEVGRWLKRDLSLPWIADFRDPPLLDERSRPKGWSRMMLPRHRTWLDAVYAEADAVLHAVPTHARWARLTYPERRKRCAILRHPVPADLAAGLVEPIRSASPQRRTICVVGSLRPDVLLLLAQATAALVTSDSNLLDLELRLVGRPLDDPQPLEALLGDRLLLTGRVANSVAKQHMVGSDVLVNAVSPERQKYLGISSKLYEYAAARRPIVVINPTRPDRRLLHRLPAQTIDNPTPNELTEALRLALALDRAEVAAATEPFIQSYSWQLHSERLAKVIECVTDSTLGPYDLRGI